MIDYGYEEEQEEDQEVWEFCDRFTSEDSRHSLKCRFLVDGNCINTQINRGKRKALALGWARNGHYRELFYKRSTECLANGPVVDTDKYKKCAKCGETKPHSQFHNNSTRSDGKSNYCKACISQYKKSKRRKVHYGQRESNQGS